MLQKYFYIFYRQYSISLLHNDNIAVFKTKKQRMTTFQQQTVVGTNITLVQHSGEVKKRQHDLRAMKTPIPTIKITQTQPRRSWYVNQIMSQINSSYQRSLKNDFKVLQRL